MYFCKMKLLTALFVFVHLSLNAQNTVLNPADFDKGMKSQKVQVLDVRTPGEFNQAHLANALQADWLNAKEFQERTKYLDSSLPVYVYCQAGVRSHNAAVFLREQKRFKVYELDGGISAWMSVGLPVVQITKVTQMSLDSFKNSIPKTGLCLVDFNAKWCAPCVKMKPSIDSLSQHYKYLCSVSQIDGAVQTDILKPMQVLGFPTLIIYKDGVEVWRQQGFMGFDDLLAKLNSFK
jgi:rhodanese-related sulfurtransferase